MALWDKVKQELDEAGKVARDAIDEGRIRLDAFRARQQADKAAQALGYATYRAKASNTEVDPDTSARLQAALEKHEREAARLELLLEDTASRRKAKGGRPADAPASPPPPPPPAYPPPPPPPSAASTAPPPPPPSPSPESGMGGA